MDIIFFLLDPSAISAFAHKLFVVGAIPFLILVLLKFLYHNIFDKKD